MTALAMTMMLLQVVIGLSVVAGAVVTLTHSIDGQTPAPRRVLFVLMLVAGAWYAMEPLVLGVPTSTKPGLLFAGFTAWVMLRWQSTLLAKAHLN
jgi:hypothetical protein